MAGLTENKIVLVTGAASGIGRAAARLFATEGATVVGADLDAEGGAETAALIESDGGKGEFRSVDVTA